MKYVFKSKNKYKGKIFNKIIFMTIILVIIFTFFLLYNFNKNINDNLIQISSLEIEKKVYSFITKEINNDILNKETLKNILVITKNNNDEILYVDFDLDKAYKVLDNVSNILNNSFEKMENGEIEVSYFDDSVKNINGLFLAIPVGNVFDSLYFYNLGPKVPVKVNFVGTVLSNLETKVTNYGLNNALVEVFVYIEFHNQIIAPFKTKDITFKYDAVIASMMIEGEVPSFYNGTIEKSSNVYSKSIE